MMYALIACVVIGAVLAVAKGKLPQVLKGAVIGAAVVISALMLAIDAKFWGVVVMGGAVVILFFLPWLDNTLSSRSATVLTGTNTCTPCS